jgi:hypothetical protein
LVAALQALIADIKSFDRKRTTNLASSAPHKGLSDGPTGKWKGRWFIEEGPNPCAISFTVCLRRYTPPRKPEGKRQRPCRARNRAKIAIAYVM